VVFYFHITIWIVYVRGLRVYKKEGWEYMLNLTLQADTAIGK
jgi:hypothetical protein